VALSEQSGSAGDAPTEYEDVVETHDRDARSRLVHASTLRDTVPRCWEHRTGRPAHSGVTTATARCGLPTWVPLRGATLTTGCHAHLGCHYDLVSTDATPTAPRTVLRISRAALIAVVIALVGASPLAIAAPIALGWVVLLPLVAGVWVLRVRTTADADGLVVRRALSTRSVRWEEVDGIRFPSRSWGRAVLRNGTEIALPAVGFNDLRALAHASGGRVPDPFAAAAQARRAPADVPEEPAEPAAGEQRTERGAERTQRRE